MTNNRLIPRTDSEKAVWLKNLAAKLGTYQTVLGITAAEVTSLQADSAIFAYTVDMVEIYKNESKKRVAFKNILLDGDLGTPLPLFPGNPTMAAPPALVPAGIFKRVANLIQRIKHSPVYNEAIGQDLGIIATEEVMDALLMKPELKGLLDAGRPLIKWKKGKASSIDIYVDRKDGHGFVFLTNDSQPDYIDTYELPTGQASAVWDYKAIYRVGDEQAGEFSDTIKVTVAREVSV